MKMIKSLRLSWQLAVTALLAVAMLSAPFLGTATAQAASNAQAGTAIHYSDKQVLADGGINYTFNINGVSNILHEPPDGFTPVTATDAQLVEYGFPARPTDTAALAAWTTKWSRFKVQRSSSDPVLTLMPAIESASTVSPQVNPPAHIGYPATWSGYGDYDLYVNYFKDVTGEYYQPTYGSSSSSGAQELSFVGLGGYMAKSSLMVGSGMQGPASSPSYYAWYGYANSSGTSTFVTYSGAVNAGDDIDLQTFWQPNSNYPAAFDFFDFNTMTNFYITAQLSSSYYDGETAEFIDGRPSVAAPHTASSTPLADYGTNTWMDCDYWTTAGSGSGTGFANINENNPNTMGYMEFMMQDSAGNYLSSPTIPPTQNPVPPPSSSSGFTDTFIAAS